MAVSAYGLVVDALVDLYDGPAGTVAADGVPGVDDPSDFLAVGVPSLSESGPVYSGSSRQEWATVGQQGARDEAGEVRCIAAARSQDETVKDARDRALAIFEAVQTLCRTTPTLGVDQLLWSSVGTDVDVALLYEEGQPPAVLVEFTVAYRARL